MNLSEAQTELFARGFDYLTATRAMAMLNDAKNQFEDAFPFPWLETTTSGTGPLTITDLKYVQYVQDTTNDRELLGLPAQQIAVGGSDITLTGTPVYWWLDGTSALLNTWPVSSSVQLSVRYVKFSPELSATTDTPLIPVRYHSTWIDFAVVRAYQDSDNHSAAMALLQDIERRMESVIEVYAARNRQNPEYQTIRYASEDW